MVDGDGVPRKCRKADDSCDGPGWSGREFQDGSGDDGRFITFMGTPMELPDYDRQKLELADILRTVSSALPEAAKKTLDEPIRALFARLAEDRFNLVVVGRFSRGKTSLMNAILGTDRLPTGIVPLTSVITAVSYGSTERVRLTFEGGGYGKDIAVDELPSYITQQGNPGNVRRVKVAEVQLPSEILRRGFYFVDTPGLGSPIPESTRTTESFLPEADAFLLVTGYESPLSDDELDLLREALPSARRTFVIVNKHDTVRPADRQQALTYVHDQLENLFGENAPKVFSVSARDGLEAKLSGDQARLEESGVATLEETLIHFLVGEKQTQFLLRLCDRVEAVIHQVSEGGDSQTWIKQLDTLRRELGAEQGELPRRSPSYTARHIRPGATDIVPMCQICEAVDRRCFDFLCHYQHDLLVNPARRRALSRQGGLCSLHTWQYASMAGIRDIGVAYAPFLERSAELLNRISGEAHPPAELATVIEALHPSRESCDICRVCDEAESEAVTAIANRLNGASGEVASLSAICLRHLPRLLAAIDDPDRARAVLAREADLFGRVAEDMKRYALKFDAIRRPLASEAEGRASARGVRLVAGNMNMSFAKRTD